MIQICKYNSLRHLLYPLAGAHCVIACVCVPRPLPVTAAPLPSGSTPGTPTTSLHALQTSTRTAVKVVLHNGLRCKHMHTFSFSEFALQTHMHPSFPAVTTCSFNTHNQSWRQARLGHLGYFFNWPYPMLGVMQPVPTSLISQRMASLQTKTVPWNSPVAFLHQTLKRDGAPKLDNGELLSAKLHPVLRSLKKFPPQGDRCYTASSATDARYFYHQTFRQRLHTASSASFYKLNYPAILSWHSGKKLADPEGTCGWQGAPSDPLQPSRHQPPTSADHSQAGTADDITSPFHTSTCKAFPSEITSNTLARQTQFLFFLRRDRLELEEEVVPPQDCEVPACCEGNCQPGCPAPSGDMDALLNKRLMKSSRSASLQHQTTNQPHSQMGTLHLTAMHGPPITTTPPHTHERTHTLTHTQTLSLSHTNSLFHTQTLSHMHKLFHTHTLSFSHMPKLFHTHALYFTYKLFLTCTNSLSHTNSFSPTHKLCLSPLPPHKQNPHITTKSCWNAERPACRPTLTVLVDVSCCCPSGCGKTQGERWLSCAWSSLSEITTCTSLHKSEHKQVQQTEDWKQNRENKEKMMTEGKEKKTDKSSLRKKSPQWPNRKCGNAGNTAHNLSINWWGVLLLLFAFIQCYLCTLKQTHCAHMWCYMSE